MEIYNEIVREIKGHTNAAVGNTISSLGFDFGDITANGLKLDSFKYEVDYMVLEHLKLDKSKFSSTTDELHTISTPNQLRPLQPGDRVLVACIGQNDFVVVGRVTNA